ncbi:EVE domain-containing protein [Paraburkholderia caffeinilytica]|uniref:EVE domain-containing protein n=1 Tax=Paraburkholderia caffeinilytica TaxID=1761016 RepID=UPI003DA0E9A2
MAYFLTLFSPETYAAFTRSLQDVSGFRYRQRSLAQRVKPGDKFVCYLTKLSRWVGLLEVTDGPYEDKSPIFYPEDDPFTVRFKVKPLIWLDPERAVPIQTTDVWQALSFTKDHDSRYSRWTGKIRSSLAPIEGADGDFLQRLLESQLEGKRKFPLTDGEKAALETHTVRRADKTVAVTVPTETRENIQQEDVETVPDVRESIKIQAMLAEIGSQMGLKIWIPKADRGGVFKEWKDPNSSLIDRLPLNYDDATLKTIEQIDVLWLRGRSIVRAFEVEHTTSVYSGLLRMADLLALQPNMDIKLHIVAPVEKREKVFQEIRRPVFSLLERGPLSELCSYLNYDSLKELAAQKHLAHLSDTVLEEYAEDAE